MIKAKAHDRQQGITVELREQIEQEKNARKESLQRQKAMQEELNAAQTSGSKKARVVKRVKPSVNENYASSSGRVSSNSGKRKARQVSDPYPICKSCFGFY
jgi:hypothetical protein